jgi:hypothetical protein
MCHAQAIRVPSTVQCCCSAVGWGRLMVVVRFGFGVRGLVVDVGELSG